MHCPVPEGWDGWISTAPPPVWQIHIRGARVVGLVMGTYHHHVLALLSRTGSSHFPVHSTCALCPAFRLSRSGHPSAAQDDEGWCYKLCAVDALRSSSSSTQLDCLPSYESATRILQALRRQKKRSAVVVPELPGCRSQFPIPHGTSVGRYPTPGPNSILCENLATRFKFESTEANRPVPHTRRSTTAGPLRTGPRPTEPTCHMLVENDNRERVRPREVAPGLATRAPGASCSAGQVTGRYKYRPLPPNYLFNSQLRLPHLLPPPPLHGPRSRLHRNRRNLKRLFSSAANYHYRPSPSCSSSSSRDHYHSTQYGR
jgi:hypothetical protein